MFSKKELNIQDEENNPRNIQINMYSFTKAFILASAWGGWHTLRPNNLRYYFNPYTLRLEIITTDQTRPNPNLDDLFKISNEALFDPFNSVTATTKYSINDVNIIED